MAKQINFLINEGFVGIGYTKIMMSIYSSLAFIWCVSNDVWGRVSKLIKEAEQSTSLLIVLGLRHHMVASSHTPAQGLYLVQREGSFAILSIFLLLCLRQEDCHGVS